jgi:hypothetical protein
MQPVYFLPNVSPGQVVDATGPAGKINRKVLQAHGLLGIFGDLRGKGDITISNGKVEGKSGCLLAYGAPDKFTNPASLEWIEGPAWIGYDKDNPPTEEDLRRKRLVGGYKIEGEDGQSWQVPIIRRPDDSTELPCDMYYEVGVLKEPVKEAYKEFWDATAEVASWFFNDSGEFGGDSFSKQKAFDLAVQALGINYRFGHQEQRVTKAVTSENFILILSYTVDYPRQRLVHELSKKNLSPQSTPNTTPGTGDDLPTTAPVGPTCGLAP